MHTIKPTTLPFNPEHHIALEVEITYPKRLIARDGYSLIAETSGSVTHHTNMLQSDMFFLMHSFKHRMPLFIEGIEDTATSVLISITTGPLEWKLCFEAPVVSVQTEFASDFERQYLGVW